MTTPHVEPLASKAQAQSFGLSDSEWDRVVQTLGRTPTLTEAGLFSALWSEHCSYKSSRVHLRGFPSKGARVAQGPGENAGAIDLGDDVYAVFKIESHNHPSYIEPVQGAATGVGGILRDIFTMGARPIALMNSLRFGRPDHEKTPFLLRGVVKGIGGYGNSMGVPTVAGEVYFDPSYDGNILVNAFALGVCTPKELVRAVAKGPGNLVVYLGAKTGRDGIHGATMASASFDESTEEKRPTVQVGDPFKEKMLLEACMEMFKIDCLVGIQDMGAAGLSSSSSEMAARGNVGLELDVSLVPTREANMTPYEMMLSESQERMLLCVEPQRLPEIQAIAHKWELDCAVIGKVIKEERLRIKYKDVVAADVPVKALTDDAPLYERPYIEPPLPALLDESTLKDLPDLHQGLLTLLATPNLASKKWIYRQYDQDVQVATVRRSDTADAAVVRLDILYPGRKDALAMKVDCNSRYVKANAFEGAKSVAMECYRNLAATGARALAISDCLNFGSPEQPEVMGQLAYACKGLSDAARVLETPVVSGNVSLYNQTGTQSIDPTPTVAMVGQIKDVANAGRSGAQLAGLDVWVFGVGEPRLSQSEYLFALYGRKEGRIADVDLALEKRVCDIVTTLWEDGLLHAAHDVSEGGWLVALSELVLSGTVGVTVSPTFGPGSNARDAFLFGEGGSRFWLCAKKEHALAIAQFVAKAGLDAHLRKAGETVSEHGVQWDGVGAWTRAELEQANRHTIAKIAAGQ